MPMTKRDFIALADAIRRVREHDPSAGYQVSESVMNEVADVCKQSNPRFNRDRWFGYIRGENGPNGGRVENACPPIPRKRRRAMLLGKDVNESRWDGITNQ